MNREIIVMSALIGLLILAPLMPGGALLVMPLVITLPFLLIR